MHPNQANPRNAPRTGETGLDFAGALGRDRIKRLVKWVLARRGKMVLLAALITASATLGAAVINKPSKTSPGQRDPTVAPSATTDVAPTQPAQPPVAAFESPVDGAFVERCFTVRIWLPELPSGAARWLLSINPTGRIYQLRALPRGPVWGDSITLGAASESGVYKLLVVAAEGHGASELHRTMKPGGGRGGAVRLVDGLPVGVQIENEISVHRKPSSGVGCR